MKLLPMPRESMILFMFERPLKLRHGIEQNVFFTSDTHFNHNKEFVFKSRGYNDRYEHNEALITKINECIRAQDILFHLGDFCLNITPPEFQTIISRINCQNIYYIWGNHNSCIRKYYEDAVFQKLNATVEMYPCTVGTITFLGDYKEIIVNGQLIVLHHYPHDIFNQQQKGAWQLSGHSHYTNQKTQIEYLEKKSLDVGWDGHGKPLSFDEIHKIMSVKTNTRTDNHH